MRAYGGGGLFDYSGTPGPGFLVCQKSNVRYLVMPGQVKARTRAKELDNKITDVLVVDRVI